MVAAIAARAAEVACSRKWLDIHADESSSSHETKKTQAIATSIRTLYVVMWPQYVNVAKGAKKKKRRSTKLCRKHIYFFLSRLIDLTQWLAG